MTFIKRALAFAVAGCIAFNSCDQRAPPAQTAQAEAAGIAQNAYEQKLRGAAEIVISESSLSPGKDYNLLVRREKVATVSGKNVRVIGGDVFTLKTIDGKVLASEQEHKRFLRLNRAASVYDSNGSITGYIGEEGFRDLLSLSYVFHVYDANQKEVGSSRKLGKSALNRHKLYGLSGAADYDIDKHLVLVGGDSYTLKVLNPDSSIPLWTAIFLVCIEDAIGDAHK